MPEINIVLENKKNYAQHLRVLRLACDAAWSDLYLRLGLSVYVSTLEAPGCICGPGGGSGVEKWKKVA
jgi:hypothetical protein